MMKLLLNEPSDYNKTIHFIDPYDKGYQIRLDILKCSNGLTCKNLLAMFLSYIQITLLRIRKMLVRIINKTPTCLPVSSFICQNEIM